MNKTSLILVIVAVLAVAGCFLPSGNTVVDRIVGASPGPDVYNRTFFRGGATVDGGGVYATSSTAATYTLTNAELAQIAKGKVVSWTPNVNTTISIGATSTKALVPNVGDTATIYFRNASSTAAATVTFAAVDTSLDLQDNEDSADLALAGLDWMKMTLINNSNTLGAASQVTLLLEEMTEAD